LPNAFLEWRDYYPMLPSLIRLGSEFNVSKKIRKYSLSWMCKLQDVKKVLEARFRQAQETLNTLAVVRRKEFLSIMFNQSSKYFSSYFKEIADILCTCENLNQSNNCFDETSQINSTELDSFSIFAKWSSTQSSYTFICCFKSKWAFERDQQKKIKSQGFPFFRIEFVAIVGKLCWIFWNSN